MLSIRIGLIFFLDINLAKRQPSWQSSNGSSYYGHAENAVDGNALQEFLFQSCTKTKWENQPWWIVDLKYDYQIVKVEIVNRGDCCSKYNFITYDFHQISLNISFQALGYV